MSSSEASACSSSGVARRRALGMRIRGAAMSAAGSVIYSAAVWKGVCALGALTAATALGYWLVSRRR